MFFSDQGVLYIVVFSSIKKCLLFFETRDQTSGLSRRTSSHILEKETSVP